MSASRNILHILDGAPRDDAVAPALARAGHRVMAAGIDGAWRWLAENPCALILLDLDLPGLDSEKFLGQLRQRGLADSLSVVALISTDTPRASLDAALAAGADGYLALPLTEADLRAQVAIHLRQRTLTNQLRASEARLARAQRVARLGSWELDMASRQLRWSAELARILGLPEDGGDNDGERLATLVHPDDRAALEAAQRRALAGGGPMDLEVRIRRADGGQRWVRVQGGLEQDGEGNSLRFVGTVLDITEGKRHDLLRAWESRILEAISVGERQDVILDQVIAGVGELIPEAMPSILLADDTRRLRLGKAPGLPEAFSRAVDGLAIGPRAGVCGTAAHRRELVIVADIASDPLVDDYRELARAHGIAACWSMPVMDSAGEVLATFALYHPEPHQPSEDDLDLIRRTAHLLAISLERHRTESAMRRREADLQRANEQLARNQSLLHMASHLSRLGGWAHEVGSGTLLWSDELKALHEVPDHYRPSLDQGIAFYAPEYRGQVSAAVARCLAEGEPFDLELELITARGRRLWVRSMGEAVRDERGAVVRIQGAIQDISARVAAEQSLRESEERFRLLARATDDAIWDWNLLTDALWWSEGFETLFGYRRAEVEPTIDAWSNRIHPEDRDHIFADVQRALDGGANNWSGTYRFRRADGSHARVLDRGHVIRDPTGKPVRMVGGMSDHSQRLALEEQLRRAQRLESVGQLTGGLAHDFNNLLTVILGNADQLVDNLAGEARHQARMIQGAAQRGAELTQGLLAFARQQPLDPRVVDIHQLVAGMEGLLRRTLGEHIDIGFGGDGQGANALVDPAQLESALLNLAINARDAMPAGGRLTIETRRQIIDEDYLAQYPDVRPGDYVLVAVSDSGEGIAPEHLPRLFEPFFTTKETGKGTGLGLPMVYGFIKQSGGHVSVYSELGQGTTVRLYLPRVEEVAQRPPEGEAAPEGGSETLLLVEDDELVRGFARDQLTRLGYRVLEAGNGPDAMAILRQRDDIDLLFTDMVMPGGMSGRDLAEHARVLRPGLRVLYTSGYTQDAIVHHGRLDPGVLLLNKPYRRNDLARKIREALGSAAH
ncbi:MAG: PAS domain-containing protein [Porticoccaceae bacterium]|jgi:PAS domain S-box-containing protein|nr:PAS domain-containing protein [Porticoccaceae bacterium]